MLILGSGFATSCLRLAGTVLDRFEDNLDPFWWHAIGFRFVRCLLDPTQACLGEPSSFLFLCGLCLNTFDSPPSLATQARREPRHRLHRAAQALRGPAQTHQVRGASHS